jgi:hypothetical protein
MKDLCTSSAELYQGLTMLLKNIDRLATAAVEDRDEDDLMSDIRYICKSCSLITDALQKGCDVMQMPNGDIIISELKTVTLQYTWDDKKGKLIRTQMGQKHRKPRLRRGSNEVSDFEPEEILEHAFSEKETV